MLTNLLAIPHHVTLIANDFSLYFSAQVTEFHLDILLQVAALRGVCIVLFRLRTYNYLCTVIYKQTRNPAGQTNGVNPRGT